jgi:AcrR family transcriptional regulator
MPRAFTSQESAQIRDRLKRAALDAFGRRGLQGTTVAELAQAAAISKGAFYRFYASKEALLVELMSEIETAMHEQVLAAVRADPATGVEILIDSAVRAVDRNPLFTVLMSPEALHVLRALPEDQREELVQRDAKLVAQVIPLLESNASAPGVAEDVLLGLLRSLVFVGFHREDIGSDFVDALAGWIVDRLRPTTSQPVPAKEASSPHP